LGQILVLEVPAFIWFVVFLIDLGPAALGAVAGFNPLFEIEDYSHDP